MSHSGKRPPLSASPTTQTDRTVQPATRVQRALEQSQKFGFLGPGTLDLPMRHADAFVDIACAEVEAAGGVGGTCSWLDLGSGGGLPGLVGIDRLADSTWVLLDAQAKRIRFLRSVVADWDVSSRVICVLGRAEEIYQAGQYREVEVVVARGFGQPSVTAECATGFLPVGGILVVSEPPDSDGSRWDGVDQTPLGLVFDGVRRSGGFGFAVLRKVRRQASQIPRTGAALARNPLFSPD